MTILRVHDPSRRSGWTDDLTATQLAVFLRDVKTQMELGLDGKEISAGAPGVCYVFDSLAEAEQFCTERITQFERMQCEIYDRRGKLLDPIRTFVNPRYQRHLPTRRSARVKILIGVLLLAVVAPALFWLDWWKGGSLIVPSAVAIACVATAVRLLDWGYTELASLKSKS